jgi:hypothetical protein
MIALVLAGEIKKLIDSGWESITRKEIRRDVQRRRLCVIPTKQICHYLLRLGFLVILNPTVSFSSFEKL